MRIRDDKKQEALFRATISLVNEIGFSASSVSKIAKKAGVSPATLYVYYKNKEDLLVSTYLTVKENMGAAVIKDFDEGRPIRDSLYLIWMNTFRYASENMSEFRYAEQFSNSPYSELVDRSKTEKYFQPVKDIVQRGIEQKILKDVSQEMIIAFLFNPILALANPYHCKGFIASDENVSAAFSMAWDALRL